MSNQHNRVVNMSIENKPKRVRGPRNHILQRFAIRKSNQMGGGKPCSEEFGIGFLDFLITPELPCTIVDIVEFSHDLGFDTTRPRDSMAGFDASLHGAGIDFDRSPRGPDAPGDGLSFGKPTIS